MISRVLGLALERMALWFDDSIPVTTLHKWFHVCWEQSIAVFKDSPTGDESGALHRVLHETADAAYRAGLLTTLPSDFTNARNMGPADALLKARQWARWPEGKLIVGGFVLPGAGQHLDVLAAAGDPQDAGLVANGFESLLRHVETRRRSALTLRNSHDHREGWLEKHHVAVALSRHSCRTRDLRWLNAALKLNDWAFPVHQRLRPSLQLAHYLRAVAEQEAAARELFA